MEFWKSVKAPDRNIDRMDRAATENFENPIAGLLELQSTFDFEGKSLSQFHGTMAIEKVRGMEQMDMKHVAFNPLSAVNQSP